jgi:hypothetical protein
MFSWAAIAARNWPICSSRGLTTPVLPDAFLSNKPKNQMICSFAGRDSPRLFIAERQLGSLSPSGANFRNRVLEMPGTQQVMRDEIESNRKAAFRLNCRNTILCGACFFKKLDSPNKRRIESTGKPKPIRSRSTTSAMALDRSQSCPDRRLSESSKKQSLLSPLREALLETISADQK